MGDEAEGFRRRARECREIAERANDGEWRRMLVSIAEELDEEADRIDADDARKGEQE